MKTFKIACIVTLILFLSQQVSASYQFMQCNTLTPENLQQELNTLAQGIFDEGTRGLNFREIIRRLWVETGMDRVIDREVDRAVASVKAEHGYWQRLSSGWSSEKARDLSEKVAERTFGSDNFHRALEELSGRIGEVIANELAIITDRSATTATLCLAEFVEERYSQTMVEVFSNEVEQKTRELDVHAGSPEISAIGMHKAGLAGIAVIIASQIARRMAANVARQISQRILGRILARAAGRLAVTAIPVVGWIVGGGLIAYDLYSGSDGALPEIAKQLKQEEVKEMIREEVYYAVNQEVRGEIPKIAREVANELYSHWADFSRKFARVLQLVEQNRQFKTVVESRTPREFSKIANFVDVIENRLSTELLHETIDAGVFDKLLDLPDSAIAILETTRSPQMVIAWSQLAGTRLPQVIELEIFKHKQPDDFKRDTLVRLIELNDSQVISKIMLLNNSDLEHLLQQLSKHTIITLGQRFTPRDFETLAWYAANTETDFRNILVNHLLSDPAAVRQFNSTKVQTAVLESREPQAIIVFMARPSGPVNIYADGFDLLTGAVPMSLLFEKYPNIANLLLITLGPLLAIMSILFVIRWMFRRRRPAAAHN